MEAEDYFRINDADRWSRDRVTRYLEMHFEGFNRNEIQVMQEKLFHYMIMNGVSDPRDMYFDDILPIISIRNQ
jgi:hypothetical protein